MYYLLDENKNPYPVDVLTMGKAFEADPNKKRVKFTEFEKYYVEISTVFLGIDHNWLRYGTPILFETMIFWSEDQELNQWQDRYCTWKQAYYGHNHAVRLVIEEIRKQLAENPNKIFIPQKSLDQKCTEFVKSLEEICKLDPVIDTPEYEFIMSTRKNLKRYRESQK